MADRVLCTFPGRAGDIGWALPTVRAISESVGHPVDLQIAGEFAPLVDLLRLQPYLGHVSANPHWAAGAPWEDGVPLPVGTPEGTYDRVIHLGYRRWPELPLPVEVEHTLHTCYDLPAAIDLARPWITLGHAPGAWAGIPVGWTDCWFELKVGLTHLLTRDPMLPSLRVLAPKGSRWHTEAGEGYFDWLEAATRIAASRVFLGDCSALHVLAVALGKPCVLVEPMEARWNPIFWPLGMDGRVRCVKGLDGRPTFDARHTADTLQEVLDAHPR